MNTTNLILDLLIKLWHTTEIAKSLGIPEWQVNVVLHEFQEYCKEGHDPKNRAEEAAMKYWTTPTRLITLHRAMWDINEPEKAIQKSYYKPKGVTV